MFFFGNSNKQHEVQAYLRRLADLTVPNLPPLEGEVRSDNRLNRTFPILLTPWDGKGPILDEFAIALTKDLSSTGLSVVLPQPFRAEQVLVGFWPSSSQRGLDSSEPAYLWGDLRQTTDIGGGYWQLGIELLELLENGHPAKKQLKNLAARLIPSSAPRAALV